MRSISEVEFNGEVFAYDGMNSTDVKIWPLSMRFMRPTTSMRTMWKFKSTRIMQPMWSMQSMKKLDFTDEIYPTNWINAIDMKILF